MTNKLTAFFYMLRHCDGVPLGTVERLVVMAEEQGENFDFLNPISAAFAEEWADRLTAVKRIVPVSDLVREIVERHKLGQETMSTGPVIPVQPLDGTLAEEPVRTEVPKTRASDLLNNHPVPTPPPADL